MFGFSLTKLLLLALIIGGVLLLFKVLGRKSEAGGPSRGPSRVSREDNTKSYETEYDAESDTYVVRKGKKRED